MSYDNWKLASPDDEGPHLVSPCCGDEYSEKDFITEMGEQYICNKCNELFDYPEEDHEHADRMRENALEDRMDEDRLEK
tara:strand:+ start:326 stop:562 length:237 start_codon:yes stop_codon:yes gene_type:complete